MPKSFHYGDDRKGQLTDIHYNTAKIEWARKNPRQTVCLTDIRPDRQVIAAVLLSAGENKCATQLDPVVICPSISSQFHRYSTVFSMASPVKLFVYDVTRGMARTLAPMLLGLN